MLISELCATSRTKQCLEVFVANPRHWLEKRRIKMLKGIISISSGFPPAPMPRGPKVQNKTKNFRPSFQYL